jgi:3-phosphoshikimate 1-carboxyvinyltransferase
MFTMIASVNPSSISGVIDAPASKSSMQRACAAALLSVGTTTILNPGHSNDDLAAIDVITKLGAAIISQDAHKLVIKSNGVEPVSSSVNCGESGLGIRMFTPLAALSSKELIINGTGSLLKRPMHFFDEIFPALGISIKSNNGHLPLNIKGPLQPANIEIDGSLSSQFLTGLLMAFAAAGAANVEIKVNNLKSKPYIDLTLDVMKQFGVEVENNNYESFRFFNSETANPLWGGVDASAVINTEAFMRRGRGGFTPTTYTVEGDWSGGAFLLVAGAIAGKIKVNGLNTHSTQADKEIMKALIDCGAEININDNEIEIGLAELNAFSFDATDCPDLFPPLVALAAYCEGTTIIKGVSRLAHKESNRGITLQDEFAKMGVKIDLEQDIMKVYGDKNVKGATVHSRHDHRIAMASAVAALKANGNTIIEEADAINKSYPDFYEHLASLGAIINNKILQP